MATAETQDLIPVTILTGFLGAGKTTLLNRILSEKHGEKIAVIENEFGETGIDNEILVKDKDEQIVEMNNGCLCCTVRGDLVRILADLGKKRKQGKLKFDRVIIETTGLANPGPVAQTFFMTKASTTSTCSMPWSRWWTRCTRRSSWMNMTKPAARSASPTGSCSRRPTWSTTTPRSKT
jgi:predicted ATPase